MGHGRLTPDNEPVEVNGAFAAIAIALRGELKIGIGARALRRIGTLPKGDPRSSATASSPNFKALMDESLDILAVPQ